MCRGQWVTWVLPNHPETLWAQPWGNHSFRTAGLCRQKGTALRLQNPTCINMDGSNKRAERRVAFRTSDLQIDGFQFGTVILSSHVLANFPSSGFNCRDWILYYHSQGSCCACFLLIFVTGPWPSNAYYCHDPPPLLLLPPAAPQLFGTRTQTDPGAQTCRKQINSRLKLWKARGKQLELSDSKCVGPDKGSINLDCAPGLAKGFGDRLENCSSWH